MTPEERKELRDKVAHLHRATPYEDRPYDAWVRLADVQALLDEDEEERDTWAENGI